MQNKARNYKANLKLTAVLLIRIIRTVGFIVTNGGLGNTEGRIGSTLKMTHRAAPSRFQSRLKKKISRGANCVLGLTAIVHSIGSGRLPKDDNDPCSKNIKRAIKIN